MNKRLIYWMAGVLLAGVLAALWLGRDRSLPGPVTNEDLVAAAIKLGRATPTASVTAVPMVMDLRHPVRLAIGSLGMSNEEQDRRLGDLVLADLTGAPGLTLVERQSLDAVLRELSLSLSGLVRAKDAVRAGKLLKADWFLLGTESKINGTNAVVLVRVVDARTGILRDAQVVPANETTMQLAAAIAAFVGQSRQNAAHPKLRNFLAIGGFEDLSLNNRQAGFPNQLRSYLTAAYQKSGVTLLEREAADTLFQEVCLDLAGLPDEGGTNAPQPVQFSYWLVEGSYQSVGNSTPEVELALGISGILGPWSQSQPVLRGEPGEALFQQVKLAIDARLKEAKPWVMPTRLSEVRAQMGMGRQLAHLVQHITEDSNLTVPESYENLDEQEIGRRRHNEQQAIRAFETVLLLDPTNREAKLYLAACFRKREIGRVDEARDFYRQIIEAPIQDERTGLAQRALVASFRWHGPDEIARWFASAAEATTHPAARAFYRQQAEPAALDAAILQGEGTKVGELAEKRLMDALRRDPNGYWDGTWRNGLDDFMEAFGAKTNAGAQRLAALLPQMESAVSNLSPHLVAAVLARQTDTNTPVLEEFRKVLDRCIEHPAEIAQIDQFWEVARSSAFDWLCEHKLYSDAVKFMEGCRIAKKNAKTYPFNSFNYEDETTLAFAYKGAERWKDALAIFQSFSNKPLKMRPPVQTGKEANECREKLGLPAVHDPREFEVGGSAVKMGLSSAFAADVDGLWLGSGQRLFHLDWNLKTSFSVSLPKDASTPIHALCLSSSNIWIATGGDGLIEFDKENHRCRRFTVEDGLLMNAISCLSLAENQLWIGYGHKGQLGPGQMGIAPGGGVGYLDFVSNHFMSFQPSLAEGGEAQEVLSGNRVKESPANPTRRVVWAIAAGASGVVWFLDEQTAVRRFQSRQNLWEATPMVGRCLVIRGAKLFVGQTSREPRDPHSDPGPLGVRILDSQTGQWASLDCDEGLPAEQVSAIAVDGEDLWVGGLGYIALVDAKQNQIRKFAYIPANVVDQIQIGGGCVWAQYNGCLRRVSLAGAP